MTKRYLGKDFTVGEGDSIINLGAYAAAQTDHGFSAAAQPSYFGPLATGVASGSVTVVDTAYLVPICIARPFSLTGILMNVTAAFGGSGTEVKLALWDDNGHAWPNDLVASGTEAVGAATTGLIIHVVNPAIVIEPGLYFAGMESKDANLATRSATIIGLSGWRSVGTLMYSAAALYGTIVYASFPPDPFGAVNLLSDAYGGYPTTWIRGSYL